MNKSNRIFFCVVSRHWPRLDAVLPLCACFFSPPFCSVFCPKTWFVFHYFFVYCLHYTSGMRDSVVQLAIVIVIFTFSKAATFRMTILLRKGRSLEFEMPQRVYIEEFVFKWSCFCGWKKKKINVGVFLDWMWPCSSSQCSRRQTLIDFDRVHYFLLSFLHLFCIPSLLYLFAPLFANYDFAVFPDAFPLYNIRQRKDSQKEKKNHLAYFSL